jgi:hypothetical protein
MAVALAEPHLPFDSPMNSISPDPNSIGVWMVPHELQEPPSVISQYDIIPSIINLSPRSNYQVHIHLIQLLCLHSAHTDFYILQ